MALAALGAIGACGRFVERTGAPFSFDPRAAYRLSLGWGSGWHGLDTFELKPDGSAVLVRQRDPRGGGWEQATTQLGLEQLRSVTDAVVRCDVANFKRLYEDPGMHDGEQWVLCLEQAEHRRVVYCNNHFAPGIRAFRDALLHVVGTALVWQPVEASRHRAHERALWQANRDEPIAR